MARFGRAPAGQGPAAKTGQQSEQIRPLQQYTRYFAITSARVPSLRRVGVS